MGKGTNLSKYRIFKNMNGFGWLIRGAKFTRDKLRQTKYENNTQWN